MDYKELMLMYQAEIKKRWDKQAQIKNTYTFPRVAQVSEKNNVKILSSNKIKYQSPPRT